MPRRKKPNEIKESNELACSGLYPPVKSPYEERIYAKFGALLDENAEDFLEFSFMAGEVVNNQTGRQISGKELTRIEAACENLIQSYYKIYVNPEKFTFISVFQHISYDSGIISGRFNEDMKPYLLDLRERYAFRSLSEFNRLSKEHAQQLYRAINSQAYRVRFTFSLPELRHLTYATTKSYDNFGLFRKKVLEPAINEIRAKTGFEDLVYKPKKEGRKVVAVEFDITGKLETQVQTQAEQEAEKLRRKANACYEKHYKQADKPCRPRNCQKCRTCYEHGYRTMEYPPFAGWDNLATHTEG